MHKPLLGKGLAFKKIKTSFEYDSDGNKILILEGNIKNKSTINQTIPSIKIFPYGREDTILASAKFELRERTLKPAESTHFKIQLPPETKLDARDEIRFCVDDSSDSKVKQAM
jgi:hypothetical protein